MFITQTPLDLAVAYANGSDSEQRFIQNFALFLTTFLAVHLKIVENRDDKTLLFNAHQYLLKISLVDESEVFKVCLEYWNKLVIRFPH